MKAETGTGRFLEKAVLIVLVSQNVSPWGFYRLSSGFVLGTVLVTGEAKADKNSSCLQGVSVSVPGTWTSKTFS